MRGTKTASLVKASPLSFTLFHTEGLDSQVLRNYYLLDVWTLLKFETIGFVLPNCQHLAVTYVERQLDRKGS